MSTVMTASNQWRTRPSDQRFTSLTEMLAKQTIDRAKSRARVVSTRSLVAIPVEGDYDGIQVLDRSDDRKLQVTNWAFGQLCQRAGAPAGYLRTLPGPLAADNVNYGLQIVRDAEDIGTLAYDGEELRAVTGPQYGRVWNQDITSALINRFGDGVSGTFRVPGEFGRQVVVDKTNTTLYSSDRDMFVFLADEDHRIEVPNRRGGEPGSLARGFFVWNSEHGSSTFGLATFLFDYICSNRIVWGAEDYQEIRIRHTASAPHRFIEEVAPALERYANSSTASITRALEDARSKKIDRVEDFLKNRFTASQARAIMTTHQLEEGRPIETLWDAATGITAFARGVEHQDVRVGFEREAGKVLDLATA
jgi:hypothetical protein